MGSKAKKWQRLNSGERSFAHRARPAVIQAALSRYRFAIPYCEGRTVCDIGCGAGPGIATLATAARRAVGLDYSAESVAKAKKSLAPKIVFVAGEAVEIPFLSDSFEVVTAFELIEHLHRPAEFLSEVRRVLSPSGTFILSTPNRPVYSPRGTWLDYHVREYDREELRELLSRSFSSLTMLGQAQLSRDAQLDCNPLNRFFYPLKRRIDPRGVVLNRLRAAYVYLRWGERPGECSPEQFPIISEGIESLPIIIAVCEE